MAGRRRLESRHGLSYLGPNEMTCHLGRIRSSRAPTTTATSTTSPRGRSVPPSTGSPSRCTGSLLGRSAKAIVVFVALLGLLAILGSFGLGLVFDPAVGMLVGLSAIPALGLAAYVYVSDVTTGEPLSLLVATFLLSIDPDRDVRAPPQQRARSRTSSRSDSPGSSSSSSRSSVRSRSR